MLRSRPLLVVGDVMLDHYLRGRVTRISPEAPVPVVSVTQETYVPGGAANVAHNLVRLGLDVSLFGARGNDASGKQLSEQLTRLGIHDDLVATDLPTTTKTRVIGEKQQIVRVDREQLFVHHALALQQLERRWQMRPVETVVVSDYGKGFCSDALCQRCVALARARGGRVVVDPKGNQWEKYRGAFVTTPNLREMSVVLREDIPNEDDALTEAGNTVRARYGLENLLITRSERGMTLVTADTVAHFPTQALDVYDVSGAGDTVVATLAAFLSNGYPLPEAIRWANAAAGYVVSKAGTYAISADELAARAPH